MASNLLGAFVASNESMAFQGSSFFDELVSVISSARNQGDTSKAFLKSVDDTIAAIIKEKTNINARCVIEHSHYVNAAAYILPVNVELFYDKYVKPVLLKEKKSNASAMGRCIYGEVDTKTGKVSGIFEKLETKIVTSSEVILGHTLTPEEAAYILLHEIGHLYTTLLLAARHTFGFQAYGDIVRQVEGSDDYGAKATVIKRNLKGKGITDADIEAALKADKGNTPNGIGVGVLSLVTRCCQDDFDKSAGKALEYSGRVLEQMADEYAMKHGSGSAGASALEKIYMAGSKKGFIGGVARAMTLLGFLLSIVSVFVIPAQMFGHVLMLFMVTFFDGLISSWLGSGTYDTGKARVGKLANQIVQIIKDANLPPEELKEYLDHFAATKKIEEKFTDAPSWLTSLMTALVPPFKRRARFTAAMADLERLASNDLYVRSQQFKLT